MRSNYKQLGNYISQVDKRNNDLSISEPKGIRINKEFMPSVANTTGTDLSKYKVVSKGQFAYNPMHVGRDEVLPICLFLESEPIIVSPAYTVFKINDPQELDPEYLMMWCRRTEFDRNVWFTTDNSIRGGFSWDSFCAMELPVPTIEKQWEIVKEYNTIVNRIRINEQLNQKLEETAQALYKHWFLDFKFPISKEYAQRIGKPELEGRPYQLNGGEMAWNEELEQEIPKGWEYRSIQSLIEDLIIDPNKDGNHGEIHPKSSDFVQSGVPFIMAKDIYLGVLSFDDCCFISKDQSKKLRTGFAKTGDVLLTHKATMGRVAIVPEVEGYIVLTPQVTYYRVKNEKKLNKEYLYCLFNSSHFYNVLVSESEQSTRKFLSITNQRLLKIILPDENTIYRFQTVIKSILQFKIHKANEIGRLSELKDVLLSRVSKLESGKTLVNSIA